MKLIVGKYFTKMRTGLSYEHGSVTYRELLYQPLREDTVPWGLINSRSVANGCDSHNSMKPIVSEQTANKGKYL